MAEIENIETLWPSKIRKTQKVIVLYYIKMSAPLLKIMYTPLMSHRIVVCVGLVIMITCVPLFQ